MARSAQSYAPSPLARRCPPASHSVASYAQVGPGVVPQAVAMNVTTMQGQQLRTVPPGRPIRTCYEQGYTCAEMLNAGYPIAGMRLGGYARQSYTHHATGEKRPTRSHTCSQARTYHRYAPSEFAAAGCTEQDLLQVHHLLIWRPPEHLSHTGIASSRAPSPYGRRASRRSRWRRPATRSSSTLHDRTSLSAASQRWRTCPECRYRYAAAHQRTCNAAAAAQAPGVVAVTRTGGVVVVTAPPQQNSMHRAGGAAAPAPDESDEAQECNTA